MPKFFWENLPFGSAAFINLLLIASIMQVTESLADASKGFSPYSSSFSGGDEEDEATDFLESVRDWGKSDRTTFSRQPNFDVRSANEKEGIANESFAWLSEVQPTDWAFQALVSLVERYHLFHIYRQHSYWGDRFLNRYEFAVRLNTCLEKIQELIALNACEVPREDLKIVQRLRQEFAAEIAILYGGIDSLEAGTTKLEAQHFSATAKLNCEAILNLDDSCDIEVSLLNKTLFDYRYIQVPSSLKIYGEARPIDRIYIRDRINFFLDFAPEAISKFLAYSDEFFNSSQIYANSYSPWSGIDTLYES